MNCRVSGVGLLVAAFALSAQIGLIRAQGSEPRIALVNPGAELERAVRVALEPWNVRVIVSDQSREPTAPRANQLARELALSHGASAAAWISKHGQGYALWVYDVASNRAVSRRLTTSPPFDAPAAAAVALSLKTLLRHSASAPEGERYGAVRQPEAPAPPLSEEASLPSAVAADGGLHESSPPRAEDTAAQAGNSKPGQPSPARTEAVAAPVSKPVQAERQTRTRSAQPNVPSRFDLETAVGYRANFTKGAHEARFGLGTSWWPRAGLAGLSARAAFGPPLTFDGKSGFSGELFDTTLGVAGRLRAQLSHGVRIFGAAGVAGEFTILSGHTLASPHERLSKMRLVPSLTVEVGADLTLRAWLRAGLRGAGALLIRPQSYYLFEQRVFELTYWTFEGTFVLSLCWPS